jgi:hypothetical protein
MSFTIDISLKSTVFIVEVLCSRFVPIEELLPFVDDLRRNNLTFVAELLASTILDVIVAISSHAASVRRKPLMVEGGETVLRN